MTLQNRITQDIDMLLISTGLLTPKNNHIVADDISEIFSTYKNVEETDGVEMAWDMYKTFSDYFTITIKLHFATFKFVKVRFGIVSSEETYFLFMNRDMQIQDMEINQYFLNFDSFKVALKEYKEKYWHVMPTIIN